MATVLNRVFWFLAKLCLRLRYRVKLHGVDQLKDLSGPTLVLPNHPGYVDPAIVLSHIRLHQPLRPLVFAGTYRMPLLRPLMSLVRAFEVPDLSSASRDAQTRTIEMIDSVVNRLQAGDCFLIYPSGRLQRGNLEIIGAARAVHDIVVRAPQANIVLVRTRGVWGSKFSCAANGTVPNLAAAARSALGWLIASFGFFLPRRPVELTIEVMPRQDLPLSSRDQFNAFLEQWYNIDGGQLPLFVRYHHLFGPGEGDYRALANGAAIDLTKIKPKTIEQVNQLLQTHLKRELTTDELQPAVTLESLGMDSLDRMDFVLRVEQQFGFRSNQVLTTVGGLWALAEGQLAGGPKEALVVPPAWFNEPSVKQSNFEPLADTIGLAMVRRMLAQPNDIALADRISSVLNNRRYLVGAAVLADQLKKLPGQRLGIMLPASVAADVAFYAAHLAGKTPVMLNWTTGPAGLAHAVSITESQYVLTSEKLVDRLDMKIVGAQYVFLETLRGQISRWDKVSKLLASYLAPNSFTKLVSQAKPTDTAVFLFTSGSESLPKTVPLTHENLLTNVCDSLDVLTPTAEDRLLGFLPPFHSFGLTGNVILPAVCSIRCVRFADPTDSRGLVATIEAYRPTLLFTTPTFLSFIMAACQGTELSELRVIVTGAERCPENVFEQCRRLAPKAVILEGYGITECSPVVAANRPLDSRSGTVGKPLRSVQTCIVNLETHQPVGQGETGMLLVRGPSIFGGYYKFDGPSPFLDVDGQQWYQTGDLVSMDHDGFITFQGRLKRFLKAGGEMISLPALEEPFQKLFPASEQGPRIAVEGIETEDGRHITLFTTFEYSLREAAQVLHSAGFTGVMRLDEVKQIPCIPVLGTGKTDYKELRKLVDAK
ncbi:MAG: AMP-binding protein [Pirellulaceae bacterium]|nr:AMP-binding protein [Pirellulaceae bacterium]